MTEWNSWFTNEYPNSEEVNEYVAQKGMHVPFNAILFGGEAVVRTERPAQVRALRQGQHREVGTKNWVRYTGNFNNYNSFHL